MRLALALVLCAAAAASAESRPHAPLALAIVIDRSGSMQGAKLESAKAGAKAAIASLAPGDRVAVIVFDSEASVIVETTPVGRDTRKLDAAIDAIVAGGGTTFVPALDAAAAQLHGQPGHHHVIFLTDGEGPTDGLDDQLARLRADAATMSAIGVGDADLAQLT
ncbi:MAG TPA: VWA domain-containing protein, partial [Kofleriaceae bacterium]|nr:VWA domain-containing protein [Kofleriaceae bacterium]